MICAIIKGPTYPEAQHQIESVMAEADCVELRLDLFDEIDIDKLRGLQRVYPKPMILTVRSQSHGGYFEGSEDARLDVFRHLAQLYPAYFDFEFDISSPFIHEIQKGYPKINVILSYHNFTHIPTDLEAILAQMLKTPAAMYKIALMANNTLDTLWFLSWAKTKRESLAEDAWKEQNKNPPNLIAICMGEAGQISRILGPLIDCPMTYASIKEGSVSAPGQLSVKTLHERYHYKQLNTSTSLFGLIGSPVTTSLSDISHNTILRQHRLDAVYVKMPLELAELKEFLEQVKKLSFKGLSITMPLKEVVMPFLDDIDPIAKEIGAVNTVVFKEGRTKGYNTDGMGALNAIERKTNVNDKKIVIIGAGGAAKAIAYEAYRRGASVVIVNRNVDNAKSLARLYQGRYFALEGMPQCYEEGYDILINTTPIELPIDHQYISPKAIIMDIKTRPKITHFLQAALEKKAAVIYGYEMFIEQALGQFHLWFGDKIPLEHCRRDLKSIVYDCLS